MNYTDFDFYKNTYYGEKVDEDTFPKWLARATDKIDHITNYRIDDAVLEAYGTQIQKAVCAVIDLLFDIDEMTTMATDSSGGLVKTRSSGGESITYELRETQISKALGSTQAQDKMLYDNVREYLGNTGLLYAGV